MAQKYTEARKEGNRRWDAENLDRVSLAMPKGTKEKIKEAAASVGESMNQYIIAAVLRRMEQETTEAGGGSHSEGDPGDSLL